MKTTIQKITIVILFIIACAGICYGQEGSVVRKHRTVYPSDKMCYFILGLPIGPYHRFEYDRIALIPIPEFAEIIDGGYRYAVRRPKRYIDLFPEEEADKAPELQDTQENPSLLPAVPEETIVTE